MKPDTSTSNPVHLAIVSPCASCQNQLTVSQNGMPACPRRVAQQNIQYMQSVGIDTTGVQHLALYGTEGTSQAGNGSYLNPVYSDNLHAILIWIALLEDNGGVLDSQGNELCPNLLDPSFNTSYIQCRSLPVTTRDNEAVYFQKGCVRPERSAGSDHFRAATDDDGWQCAAGLDRRLCPEGQLHLQPPEDAPE